MHLGHFGPHLLVVAQIVEHEALHATDPVLLRDHAGLVEVKERAEAEAEREVGHLLLLGRRWARIRAVMLAGADADPCRRHLGTQRRPD